jgi:RecJ-like exonuclease
MPPQFPLPPPSESIDASQEIEVKFIDDVFRIEPEPESAREGACSGEGVARMKKPDCDHCKDNPRRKCKHCACSVCGGKDNPDKQILCDECDMAYHLWCLVPSLDSVPDTDDW